MSEFRFYRESTGKWEDVELEKWRWVAKYTDGTLLKQFDFGTGLFHQFREIDQDRLSFFMMIADGHPPYILMLPDDKKLIHFYFNIVRKKMYYDGTPDEDEEEERYRIYVFGYEGQGEKVLFCIMPDDGVVITDDHNKIQVE